MATPFAAAGIDGKCSGGKDVLPAPIGLPGGETRVGAKAALEYSIQTYIVKHPAWPSRSGGRGFATWAVFRTCFYINRLWRSWNVPRGRFVGQMWTRCRFARLHESTK